MPAPCIINLMLLCMVIVQKAEQRSSSCRILSPVYNLEYALETRCAAARDGDGKEDSMSGREEDSKRSEGGAGVSGEGKEKGSRRSFFGSVKAYWRLGVTLALLFTIALMYQWKIIAVERVEENKRIQKMHLTDQAAQLVDRKTRELTLLAAIALSWAVQDNLAAGNLGTIDRYFSYLVKQDRFRVILLARSDGTIAVSTDKRMEGFPVDRFYNASVLRQDRPDVRPLPDGNLMAIAPVMGVAVKQGVLIIVYSPETVTLDAVSS